MARYRSHGPGRPTAYSGNDTSKFGRDGLSLQRSMSTLQELWQSVSAVPEAILKRQLWQRHLEFVYGTLVDPDELFLQHTYLTVVAKTMAVRLLVSGPVPSGELLAGTPFSRVGLNGAVKTDFFDWVLLAASGAELVDRISAQVARFRLSAIDVDILKAILRNFLIDPRQRHYLGEYYTLDWLADLICDREIIAPLETHVLDPELWFWDISLPCCAKISFRSGKFRYVGQRLACTLHRPYFQPPTFIR